MNASTRAAAQVKPSNTRYTSKDFGPATRSSIRRIVGWLHVSTSDQEVIAEIMHRMPADRFSEGFRKLARACALNAHHANQQVFRMYRF